ncbi:MAG TPA: hypothetical protein VMS22_08855 [Candidatus Eisenbacteria bacterium]|nr:hypothetical protein [Candidatus Eisenbacteria bacterium]
MVATLAALLIVLLGPPAAAATSCRASCAARMAACRAERCPDAVGKDRGSCRDACRAVTGCAAGAARIGTIAAVVNECHSTGGHWTARQRLEIRHGDCPPVTAISVDANEAAPDPLSWCRVYGVTRDGGAAMAWGNIQGFAVSPGGDTVIYQVTDDFIGTLKILGSPIASPRAQLTEEGIYRVRADGTRREYLGPQLRVPSFRVIGGETGFPSDREVETFSFSPDGKSIVFVDLGPGEDGPEAPQIFRLDLAKPDVRHQLTTLRTSQVGRNPGGLDVAAVFLDDGRVGGAYYDAGLGSFLFFTIRRNGGGYASLDPPASIGGTLITDFQLAGLTTDLVIFQLNRMTDMPPPGGPIREVFIHYRANALQLTNFRRSDTIFAQRLRDRNHVVVGASADPVGRNPRNACQLFTLDALGGHLRQITSFGEHTRPSGRCQGGDPPPSCTALLALGGEDPRTGTVVFDSTCDEFGVSPVSDQLFAVRPDGSGFRQLTAYRGVVEQDGMVTVELPGPIASPNQRP